VKDASGRWYRTRYGRRYHESAAALQPGELPPGSCARCGVSLYRAARIDTPRLAEACCHSKPRKARKRKAHAPST
jgi:hypothetical protein